MGKFHIIPVSESYMVINTFTKPPQMSYEVIRTNYTSLSPFSSSELISVSIKNDLLVWFASGHSKEIKIPEALLLYYALLSRDSRDRIALFATAKGTVLIVIKEGRLVAQSTLPDHSSTSFIDRLKKEHAVNAIDKFNPAEHHAMLNSSYSLIPLRQWQQLIHLEMPDTSYWRNALETAATPLSILVLIALGYHYGENYYLTQKLAEIQTIHSQGRGAIIPLKQKLDHIALNQKQWDTFISEGLVRPDAFISAEPLLKTAEKTDTTIKYVKVSNETLESVIDTPQATAFLKVLMKTNRYENVRLEFSKTDPLRKRDSAKIIATVSRYDLNESRK